MLQRVDDIEKLGEDRSLVGRPELARVDMIVFETRRILQAGSGRAADFHRERFGGNVICGGRTNRHGLLEPGTSCRPCKTFPGMRAGGI